MGWLSWWRGKTTARGNAALEAWRRDWHGARSNGDAGAVARLADSLTALALPDEEIEIEREMLEGLKHLVALKAQVAASDLPVVETGHRIVGADVCHFSAPASMPDDPSAPAGRLILTSARAIFVGGARTVTVPWHGVSDVLDQDRDVVLVRQDRETLHRIRCNVFDDVLSAAFLARTLAARHKRSRPASGARGASV